MKISNCYLFASLLTLPFASNAQETASTQNPYTALVSRNVFGLVPIPPPPAPPEAPIDPPPKITVNGLMRLFGNTYQVLFKTPGKAKPGLPPKEESYVMGEGERNDDIEVKKIDADSGMVTFVNHGVVQECPLVLAQNTGPAAAPSAPGMAVGGPVPTLGPGGAGRFGRVPRPNKNVTSSGEVAQQPQAGLDAANANGLNSNAANMENLSPEAQVIIMEVQREKMKSEGNPAAALFPPTPITRQLEDENAGNGGVTVPGH